MEKASGHIAVNQSKWWNSHLLYAKIITMCSRLKMSLESKTQWLKQLLAALLPWGHAGSPAPSFWWLRGVQAAESPGELAKTQAA